MSKQEYFKEEVLSMRFDGIFSMIAPNLPEGVQPNDATPRWGSFGLFGDSPDFNTFYPGIEPSDLDIKDSDFITPTYRLLSEVIVMKWGVPIDFSGDNVLRKSLKKAKGITVFPDHSFDSVANSLGVVTDVYWQESYTDNGVRVPAGINAVMKLDAKSNPRIARGIQMSPPSIHSSSVTVTFKKAKSHPEMDDNTFYEKAGSFDNKGDLIRLIATDIQSFMELSLVTAGADPFAQKVENNKIVNPDKTKSTYRFSFNKDSVPINWKTLDTFTISNTNDQNQVTMNLSEILQSLGIQSLSGITDEAGLTAFIQNLEQDSQTLTSLREVDPELSPERLTSIVGNQIPEGSVVIDSGTHSTLTSLMEIGDVEAVSARAAMGDTYLSSLRTEAINALKLVSEGDVDEAVLTAIQTSSLDAAIGFRTLYKDMVEKNIPLTCQDCKSVNVSRVSSAAPKTPPSYKDDTIAAFKRTRRKPSSFHT